MMDEEREIPREELKQMAEGLLNALGLDEVHRTEEELEVIRRAMEEWRKRTNMLNE